MTGRRRRRLLPAAAALACVATASLSFAAEGDLTVEQSLPQAPFGEPVGSVVSPDGENVYTIARGPDSEGMLHALDRNASGGVSLLETERQGVNDPGDAGGTVGGLRRPTDIAIVPSGDYLYVTDDLEDSVAIFARDTATGRLSFVELQDNLGDLTSIYVTGPYAVATADDENALLGFARNASGHLNLIDTEVDGTDDGSDAAGVVEGLAGASDVEMLNTSIFATGATDDALAVFVVSMAGEISFVESHRDGVSGVDGIDGAKSVVASPTLNRVYVAGPLEDSVAAFERNSTTGALTYIEAEKDGVDDPDDPNGVPDGLDQVSDLAISHDGFHIYTAGTGDNAIGVFGRNMAGMGFREVERDGIEGPNALAAQVDGLNRVNSVVLDPESEDLYATSSGDEAVTVFGRDLGIAGGNIRFEGRFPALTIGEATQAVTSPDGAHVYVTSRESDSVLAFSRDDATGQLTFVEAESDARDDEGDPGAVVSGLSGASGLAISPNGESVYVTGLDGDSVAEFGRDPVSGELSFVGSETEGQVDGQSTLEVSGLDGASGVTVSDDNAFVYVASSDDDSLVTFERMTGGALSYVGAEADGEGGVPAGALAGAAELATSPQGFLYVSARDGDGVSAFEPNASTGVPEFRDAEHHGVDDGDDPAGAVASMQVPRGLALSPGGESLYVAATGSDAVGVFDVDPVTGKLAYRQSVVDLAGGVQDLDGPSVPAVTSDGAEVLVATESSGGVVSFDRDQVTGALGFAGSLTDERLAGASDLALFDDRDLYVPAAQADSITLVAREGDTTPPQTEITEKPPNKQKVSKGKAEVTFGFSSPDDGIAFECRKDTGEPWASCDSPYVTKYRAVRNRFTAYTFSVRAIDAASNADPSPAQHSFKLKRK